MSIPGLVRFALGVLLIVFLTAGVEIRQPSSLVFGAKEDKSEKKEKREKASERGDVNDLHQEVTVLQLLFHLQGTKPQLKALADLADTTAPKPGPRKVMKITDKYYKALTALREALSEGDEEKIEEASGALEEASDTEELEFDEVEITDEARKAAPGLLKKFNARQVAVYLANYATEFPEPGEQLAHALEKSRELKGKPWRDLRDDVAYQVGWLLSGVEETAEKKVRDQITELLNKAQGLEEKAFSEQKPKLEKTLQELVGKTSPTDVLRHYMERTLAEILSNPRLKVAVDARLKRIK